MRYDYRNWIKTAQTPPDLWFSFFVFESRLNNFESFKLTAAFFLCWMRSEDTVSRQDTKPHMLSARVPFLRHWPARFTTAITFTLEWRMFSATSNSISVPWIYTQLNTVLLGKFSYQSNFHPEELKVSDERNGKLWSCKRLQVLLIFFYLCKTTCPIVLWTCISF